MARRQLSPAFEVRYVPLPKGQREHWESAIRLVFEMAVRFETEAEVALETTEGESNGISGIE